MIKRRKRGAGDSFIKKNKVISRTARKLHNYGVPYAGGVAALADALGYGRQRKKKQRGGCSYGCPKLYAVRDKYGAYL